MENEHVLAGLVLKRAEIAGQIEHTQDALRKLVINLDAIDAAMYPPRHAAFRGEMMRHVMGCLRIAEKPVTSRDVALVVMKARGLDPNDCRAIGDNPKAGRRLPVEVEAGRARARGCGRWRFEGVGGNLRLIKRFLKRLRIG